MNAQAPRFSLDDVWLGKRRVTPRKRAAAGGLVLGAFVGLVFGGSAWWVGGPLLAVSTVMLIWYYTHVWASLWPPPVPFATGSVVVEGEQVTITASDGRTMSLPLASLKLRNAWQEQRGFVAHLKTGGGDAITVTADDPNAIQALLRATGERVLLDKMRLAAWTQGGGGRQVAFGCFAILMFIAAYGSVVAAVVLSQQGLLPGIGAILGTAIMVAALVATVDRGVAEPELTAGSDGVHVRGSVVRRFIRYKDLAWAKLDRRGIRLGRRNGTEQLLPMWRAGMQDLPDDPVVDWNARRIGAAGDIQLKRARVLARIQSGIAASAGQPLGEAQLSLLDRGAKDLDVWRQEMASLLAQNEGTYRTARLDPAALAGVLESSAQPLARRVGATIALRGVEDPEVQERVRIAVESCVDDRLRTTLERATQGEVAVETLAELETEAAALSERAGGARRVKTVG